MSQDSAALDAPVRTRPKRTSRSETRPRRQPRYNVILWDDNDHSYDYVVLMVGAIFGYTTERGFVMACEVDTSGRVIVLTTTREHAELKRDQIHAFGKDDYIDNCKGSMTASIEPVPTD